MLRPAYFASLALILFTAASLGSCKKASVGPKMNTCFPSVQPSAATLLVGRWELTQTSGGLSGRTVPANPAQRLEIEFMADGQAQVLLNGTPTTTAAYTLSQRVAYLTQRPETFVEFPAPETGPSSFIAELSATTLALSQDGNDGITATYRREQPQFCGTR